MRGDEVTLFAGVVEQANLAPSVRNTQPTRWSLDEDSILTLLLDRDRLLSIADADGHGARLSCGAALEGTRIALAEIGLTFGTIDYLTGDQDQYEKVLRVQIAPAASSEAPPSVVRERCTWRGRFLVAKQSTKYALRDYCAENDDVTLITEGFDLEMLAALNDDTCLSTTRDKAFRREVFEWMRLSDKHPGWGRDGMTTDAMCLTGKQVLATKLAFGSKAFGFLSSTSVLTKLVSERDKTLSSTGVVLFHRPDGEDPVESGMAMYRFWLDLTEMGLAACPMAALTNSADAARSVTSRFNLSDDQRLIMAFRVGVMPDAQRPRRARLKPDMLII